MDGAIPRSISVPSRTIYSDRFIPCRSSSNFALFNLSTPDDDSSTNAYASLLRTALFGPDSGTNGQINPPNYNIFKFKTDTQKPLRSLSPIGSHDDQLSRCHVKTQRRFSKSPYKVLDAPALQDDFYLNLVDWSPHNVLAVGLADSVYLWHASSSKVAKLCDLSANDDSVCSVSWATQGRGTHHLAVGTSKGKVQIWDASRCKRVRTMEGHRSRAGALAWSSGTKSLLSSGSRDGSILQRDIRAREDFVSKLSGHKSEVCGLKWAYDDRELASGGNDSGVYVWNQHSKQPVLKFSDHNAAVKAIAWSPHVYGLLASGGGRDDRCIRFWNTKKNSRLSCVDTGNQVCNIAWCKNVNELVSTHGYSRNQIIVWKYPTMSKLATLTGHSYRVLFLAVSPDGRRIVTGAGDETLRFWNVFPSRKSQNMESEFGGLSLGRTQIR